MNTIQSNTQNTINKVNDLITAYNSLAIAAKQDFSSDLGANGGGSVGGGGGIGYDGGMQDPAGTNTYAYHVIKKDAGNGYTELQDSAGNSRYAKTDTLTFNQNEDKANAVGPLAHTAVYKNGQMTNTINYSGDWTQASVSGDRNVQVSGLGNANYDDDDDLHSAMKTKAEYIERGGTRYYLFKFKNSSYQHDSGEYYFAKLESFIDDYAMFGDGEGTQLNGSAKFWTFGSYDTGGYTGSWGPEGKLAMLHQKEIVLNAHDTENLLSIISMVRDMNDRIELNARAMQYGLTAAYTANNIKSQNDTLQQEVHITAEFPNATNHSEIEEAFRNLTNLASQYANRKF